MKISSKFILFIILKIIIFIIDESSQTSILFIVCYDGFRNDYLDRGLTPHLNNFRDNGVHSPYMFTIYPALAIPSLHSVATGLYPQNHAIRLRNFSSANGQQTFSVKAPSMYTQNKTSPIWALNEKNGGKSGCMMWPGTEATYDDGGCTYIEKYSKDKDLRKRVDTIVTWLENGAAAPNLVMFYVEELDRITHFFGPLSRNSTLTIKRLDLLTKYLIEKLIEKQVYDVCNIFIISDHGMEIVRQKDVVLQADQTYKPESNAFTCKNYTDDINGVIHVVLNQNIILNYTFSTEEFWKLARNKRHFNVVRVSPNVNKTVGIIEYAACPNHVLDLDRWKLTKYTELYKALYDKNNLQDPPSADTRPFGVHGYLRENDAMFMAKGPNLARFKKVPPLEMVDLYSAFTKLLNIQGDYERDGNYSRVLLIFPEHRLVHWTAIIATIAALAIAFTLTFFCLLKYLLNKQNDSQPPDDTPNPTSPRKAETE